MLLTKLVGAFMFVEEMPYVNAHADIFKPRIVELENLLLGITICVVNDMLWLLGIRNRKHALDK